MQSSLVFLGSGGDAVVVGKQLRGSGGMVLRVDDFQIHIDPGPGSLLQAAMQGINVRENTAVLVTHAHLNHCNDINAMLSAMTYNGLDNKGVLVANETLVNDPAPYLTDYHRKFVEKIIVPSARQKIGIEDIEIHALKAEHTDPHALGFRIFTPNFIIAYSGDTGYTDEIAEQYEQSDIVILNTVHPFGTKAKDNLSCDDAITIIEKTKPKLAIITHFGSKLLQADPLYEAREIQKRTNVMVMAAKEGMKISPQNYAATIRQQKLNSY